MELQYKIHETPNFHFSWCSEGGATSPLSVVLSVQRKAAGRVPSVCVFKGDEQVMATADMWPVLRDNMSGEIDRNTYKVKKKGTPLVISGNVGDYPCIGLELAKLNLLFVSKTLRGTWITPLSTKTEVLEVVRGLCDLMQARVHKKTIALNTTQLVRKQTYIRDDAQHDDDAAYVEQGLALFGSQDFEPKAVGQAMCLVLENHKKALETFRHKFSLAHAKALVACTNCQTMMPKPRLKARIPVCRECFFSAKFTLPTEKA